MKPVPIPDALVPQHWKRFTIGAPLGHEEEVHPVEAIIPMNNEQKRYVMLVQIDDEDLVALAKNGGLFWLQIYSNALPPFSVDVVDDVSIAEPED